MQDREWSVLHGAGKEFRDTHLRMGMVAVPEEAIVIVATKLL